MVGEYTPGPWKRCGLETVMLDELGIDLQDGCADFEAVGVSEGPDLNLLVALVPPALGEDGWPLADNPNLALILAAPDLLAALKELTSLIDRGISGAPADGTPLILTHHGAGKIRAAYAAIAKAEGR